MVPKRKSGLVGGFGAQPPCSYRASLTPACGRASCSSYIASFRPRNPLLLRTPEELEDDVHKFYDRNNLKDVVDLELLVKGARIAQEPDNLYTLSLTPAEFKAIKDEKESGFWQQSKDLKVTILTTACAAITQYVRLAGSHIIFRLQLTNSYRGWQQSTINAGSEGWKHDLSPQGEDWTQSHLLLGGFIDAAPWLSGSIM
ncbi:unnamed protein product [Aspergillus oryzae var. brunneus]|uniref:Unnamed protein product n=2 Tax=Aspergillus oryzae TaxID=5062 RepID=A0AAN5C0D3_ASPOZ|nr:unnamed protein product [Aspergillus oryzae]GMG32580.1 unnamed protein product [Aspergillus oryzae]GMG42025.1 unnamed protein product [Aspergillus oryzae var. brunneus]